MKTTFLLMVMAVCAVAQESQKVMIERATVGQKLGAAPVGLGAIMGDAVRGAPYSATIVTEQIQTLADGNRIVMKTQGAVARDSQGRMRHEAILPMLGNMAANKMPKMVFINDPVAGVNYTLNVTDKSYRKMTLPNAGELASRKQMAEKMVAAVAGSRAGDPATFSVHVMPAPAAGAEMAHTVPDGFNVPEATFKNESLGTKVIEGVMAEGTRTTRTIKAGEIGNDRPIEIVSETWVSTELNTLVYSKRSDPRTGDMIYSLTNLSRAEPDAALFAPPADYKVSEAGKAENVILYRTKE